MTDRVLNRVIAIFVFFCALIVYVMTLPPTVVFWDVGEFIAAAKMLQVPHPPGSPLFLLWTRIAMMIPFASDEAVRAHAVSTVASAISVMFLYLVCVRVIMNFRGKPATLADKIAVYGSSVIGALSLAYCSTFWDNSIEAEVYGVSMLFLSATMWLTMRWLERSDAEGNEKYILFIAYLVGLSLGVHLLQLLAIFPILMIIYFKRYEINAASFMKFGIVAVIVFAVIYPGIVKYLPGMMDGDFAGSKSDVIAVIPWIVIGAACYGVYWSYKHRQKMLHVALLSIVLIFVGYTTYTSVLIRSNANPPMNENDPSNLARLTAYLGREQYGDQPFWPRRYSQQPEHRGIYTNYKSEWDFMIRYQLNHMFFRYVGWNYVGSEGDFQEAGVEWKDTWGIPLLIGLLGLYYQFKKDWKMGFVFLTMFIILGPVLALYQGQQDPQPRERDYFYAGAFFVFSLWIAIGVVAIVDYARTFFRSSMTLTAFGLVALCALLVPVHMAWSNWSTVNRSGNYVAWDYSYNTLQTCEKNALLFTNGDNDTFPLWYLQDVEGIRRDVRIVNLSLINTPWYIQQMKNKPYYEEALPVPISMTDAQIARIQPIQWESRRIELPVPRKVFERYGIKDSALINTGKIEFVMNHTLQFGQTKAVRVQDLMVRDIIVANQWQRPVYFSVTVGPDTKIGLDDFLWFNGLAWRLEPHKAATDEGGLNPDVLETNLMNEPEGFSRTPSYGYKFRGVSDPSVHYDDNTSRLMVNYRAAFLRFAFFCANVTKDNEKGTRVLDRMETVVPRSKVPMGWELQSEVATLYHNLGREDRFNEYATEVEQMCRKLIDSGQVNFNSYYNPYGVLLNIYEIKKDHAATAEILRNLQVLFPKDPSLKVRLAAAEAVLKAQQQRAQTSDSAAGK